MIQLSMDKFKSELLSLEELIALHKKLGSVDKDLNIDFKVVERSLDKAGKRSEGKKSIYLLLKNNHPVYVGRSIDPFRRLADHFRDESITFDRAISFETNSFSSFPEALSYLEFLCYFLFWSKGYCLIYNSLSVWNTLPIKSKTGPIFGKRAVSAAHEFARYFSAEVSTLGLEPPDPAETPILIELGKHTKTTGVVCKALYWRPTIKEVHYELARKCWFQESKQRPQFAGAGSFLLLDSSMGRRWGNYREQRLTYDLLVQLGVIEVIGDFTKIRKSHPFPRANLMMGNLNGGQSITANSDLVVSGTSITVAQMAMQWKKHRFLIDPSKVIE